MVLFTRWAISATGGRSAACFGGYLRIYRPPLALIAHLVVFLVFVVFVVFFLGGGQTRQKMQNTENPQTGNPDRGFLYYSSGVGRNLLLLGDLCEVE
ncbi:MAG: hypothetical protein LKI93_02640, partial [Bifidobacteriaceae bacterium]|nr:hypothetical protein [Bifidobacteriaceae bacterium]